jgi:hypothetical protein
MLRLAGVLFLTTVPTRAYKIRKGALNMSPRRKLMERKTHYELARDQYLPNLFKSGRIDPAPPRGELPAGVVERREGTEDRQSCVVCPWPINGELPLLECSPIGLRTVGT